MAVRYAKPHVDRLWRTDVTQDGVPVRIFLHKIYPCSPAEALYHPHPWPATSRLLRGRYVHSTGTRDGVTSRDVVEAPSSWWMTDPEQWHSVAPVDGPAWSVMIVGPLYREPEEFARPERRQGALSTAEEEAMRAAFAGLIAMHRVAGGYGQA